MNFRLIRIAVMIATCGTSLASLPAQAQSIEQIEAESRAAETASTGIALARKQIAAGSLVDALSTLERVILNDPASDEAHLLHASLLCRLDDRRGSLVEFDRLRGHNFTPAQWTEATEPCRPGTASKGAN